jgi:ribosomal protein S18 acetylase RimI-like enzyme
VWAVTSIFTTVFPKFGGVVDFCCSLFKTYVLTVRERASQRPARVAIRAARSQDLNDLAEVLVQSFHPPVGLMSWVYPLLKLGIYEDLRSRLQSKSPHYLCLAAVVPQQQGKALPDRVSSQEDEHAIASRACPDSSHCTTTDLWEEVAGTVEISLRSSGIIGGTQYAYISNLAVGLPHRRQGIARKLLLSCEPAALDWGFREIYLHVLEDNAQARQLYSSIGYRLYRTESGLESWLFNRPRRLLLHKPLQCS